MEEPEHIKEVITITQESLKRNDAIRLNNLSNQTIHTASCMQDAGSITLATVIYALGKLLERRDNERIKEWNRFVKKMNAFLSLAVLAIEKEKYEDYERYLESARKLFTSVSINIKPYIEEVLRKSAINKASKIYEHGISLGRTAKLLGITEWELLEYTGQKQRLEFSVASNINIKKRAKVALEFFS